MSFINVVNRAGFGASSDLLDQPQSSYGQAKLSINANPVDGNLFVKDVMIPISFPGFNLQVGMVYNSQSSDLSPWRLNQGKQISEIEHDKNTGILFVNVTDSDGEIIRYNYDVAHGKYISQHPEISAELTLSANNTWTGVDLRTNNIETYDAKRRLVSQKTSDGHSMDYIYGSKDYPVGIKSGEMSVYLDESVLSRKTDLIIKENNQAKTALTYHLDLRNRIAQTVVPMDDGEDYSIDYEYTGPISNCLESIKQSDNSRLKFDYQGDKIATVKDGEKRGYRLEHSKNQTIINLPEGGIQTVDYDQQKHITSITDQQHLKKQYEYDTNNRIAKITYPDKSSHHFKRDHRGLVTVESDRQEHKTTYKFDNHSGKMLNQTEYVDMGGRVEEHNTFYVYNTKGQLSYHVAANGSVIAYRYDLHGNIFEKCQYLELEQAFNISELNHDCELSFIELSDWENTQAAIRANINHEDGLPRLALTEFEYDQYGQISKETTFARVNNTGHGVLNEKASVIKYEKDINGNILNKKIRQIGQCNEDAGEYAEEENLYDGLQRLLRYVNPLAQIIEKEYKSNVITTRHLATGLEDANTHDAGGLLKTNQQANDDLIRSCDYKRNKAGQPAIIKHPGGQKEYFVYNNKGKKRYHIDAEGYVSEFLYDLNGRQSIKITYEEKQHQVDEIAILGMNYHPEVSNILTTYRYSYYSDGRLKFKIDQDDYITQYKWNYAGKLIEEIQYNKPATFEKRKVVVDELDSKNRTHQYFYNKANHLVGEILANGQAIKYTRDLQGGLLEKRLYVTPGQKVVDWDNYNPKESANDQIDRYKLDLKGNTLKHINAENVETAFEHDAANRLKKEACEGESLEYKHDKLNRTIQETHATGLQVDRKFHANGELESEHQHDINDSSITHCNNFQYNGFAEKIKTIETEKPLDQPELQNYLEHNEKENIVRDDAGLMVAKINALGHKTHYYYDHLKRVRFTISPEGAIVEKQYNDGSNNPSCQIHFAEKIDKDLLKQMHGGFVSDVILTIVALNARPDLDEKIYFKYDGRSNPVSIIDGEKYEKTFKHDAFNDLVYTSQEVEKENGDNEARIQEASKEYDQLSRPTSISKGEKGKQDADKCTELFIYDDANGRFEHISAEQGRTVRFNDKLNREILSRDELDNETSKTWDGHNRIKTLNMPVGITETFTYFQGGKTVTKSTPLGQQFKTSNVFGEEVSSKVTNNGVEIETKTDRSHLNRHLTITYSDSSTSQIQYDDAGRESILIDQMGAKTKFERDKDGYVSKKIEDLGGIERTTSYRRNGLGKITDECDANGIWRQYHHDRRGLVVDTIIDPDGLGLTIKETFNGLGIKTDHKEGDLKDDDQYRQSHKTDIYGHAQETSVDPEGLNLISKTERNKLGKITKKIDAENRSAYYIYDAKGQERFTVNPEGVVKERCYDAIGRCTDEITHHQFFVLEEAFLGDKPSLLKMLEDNRTKNDAHTQYVFDKHKKPAFSIKHLNLANDVIHGVVTEINYDAVGNETHSKQYAQTLALSEILSLTPSAIKSSLIPIESDESNRESYKFYDELSRERYRVNHLGYLTETRYNQKGKITEVIQYANKLDLTNIEIVKTGGVDSLITKDKSQDRYTRSFYDALDREVATVSPEGVVTKKEYDAKGNLALECVFNNRVSPEINYREIESDINNWTFDNDKLNRITKKAYDNNDKELCVTNALGEESHLERNALGLCETKIDERGHDWKFNFDCAKRLINEFTPETDIILTYLGEDGKLHSDSHRARIETNTIYNKSSHTKAIVRGKGLADERQIHFNTDSESKPTGTLIENVEIDDENQQSTLHERPIKNTSLNTRVIYNALGSEIAKQNELGIWSYFVYDSFGRRIFEIDAEGAVIKNEYNAFNELVTEIKFSNKISIEFDEKNIEKLTQDIVESKLDYSSADNRITQIKYEGAEIQITQSEVDFYYDGKYSKGNPVTRKKFDNSGNCIYQAKLIGKDSWREDFYWFDREGNKLAVVDPEGYVTIYKHNASGQEVKRTEYAEKIDIKLLRNINQRLVCIDDLISLCTKGSKDRHFVTQYDLLGRKKADIIKDVVVYKLNKNDDGVLICIPDVDSDDNQAKDIVTTYQYKSDKIITTYPNLSRRIQYLNECGQVVAEKDKGRTKINKNGESEILHPLITHGLNAFGEVVLSRHHATSMQNVNDLSSAKESDEDQVHLKLIDKRGLDLVAQDAEGTVTHNTHTATKKVVRSYHQSTELQNKTIDANKQLHELVIDDQHIDETQYGYNKCDQKISEKTSRDGCEDHASPHFQQSLLQRNAFGECDGIGDKEDNFYQKTQFNTSGHIKLTNKGNGSPKIILHDLCGQETLSIESAKFDLLNTELSIDELLKQGSYAERTEKFRNLRGDLTAYKMPFFYDGDRARPTRSIKLDRWLNQIETTDSLGNTVVHEFNYNNSEIKRIEPVVRDMDHWGDVAEKQPVHVNFYDCMGSDIAYKDPNGHLKKKVRDDASQVIQTILPDGGVENSHIFDIFSNPIAELDSRGKEWKYDFNKMNNPKLMTSPVGNKTAYGYDELQRPNLTENLSFPNPDKSKDASKFLKVFSISNHDARGNVFESILPRGQKTTRLVDRNRQPLKIILPDGSTEEWERDFFGNSEKYIDLKDEIVTYQYDCKKQLLAEKGDRPVHGGIRRLRRQECYLAEDPKQQYVVSLKEVYPASYQVHNLKYEWRFGLQVQLHDYSMNLSIENKYDSDGEKEQLSVYQLGGDRVIRLGYNEHHGRDVVPTREQRLVKRITEKKDALRRSVLLTDYHLTGNHTFATMSRAREYDLSSNIRVENLELSGGGFSTIHPPAPKSIAAWWAYDNCDRVFIGNGNIQSNGIGISNEKGFIFKYKDGFLESEVSIYKNKKINATIKFTDDGSLQSTHIDSRYSTARQHHPGGWVQEYKEEYFTVEKDKGHHDFTSRNVSEQVKLFDINGWGLGGTTDYRQYKGDGSLLGESVRSSSTSIVNFPSFNIPKVTTKRDKYRTEDWRHHRDKRVDTTSDDLAGTSDWQPSHIDSKEILESADPDNIHGYEREDISSSSNALFFPTGELCAKFNAADEKYGAYKVADFKNLPVLFHTMPGSGVVMGKTHITNKEDEKGVLKLKHTEEFYFGNTLDGNIFTGYWDETDRKFQEDRAKDHKGDAPKRMSEPLLSTSYVRPVGKKKSFPTDGKCRPLNWDKTENPSMESKHYVTKQGDTLESLCRNDPDFRRLIVRHNGWLAKQQLKPGMRLFLPEYIPNKNKAHYSRSYNEFAATIKGSLQPYMKLPDPEENEIDFFKILVTVIAAAIVIYVTAGMAIGAATAAGSGAAAGGAGAGAGAAGAGAAGAGAAGAGAAASGLGGYVAAHVAATLGVTSAVGKAAIAAASYALVAGGTDAILQEAQIQMGVKDHYSFAQTASMMATAGSMGAAGSVASSFSIAAGSYKAMALNMLSAASAATATQLIQLKAGHIEKFDFGLLAAQLTGAFIGMNLDGKIADTLGRTAMGSPNMASNTVSNISHTVTDSLLGSAVTHTPLNMQAMAANAIGSTAVQLVTSNLSQSRSTGQEANEKLQEQKAVRTSSTVAPKSAHEQRVDAEMEMLKQHQATSQAPAWEKEYLEGAGNYLNSQNAARYDVLQAQKSAMTPFGLFLSDIKNVLMHPIDRLSQAATSIGIINRGVRSGIKDHYTELANDVVNGTISQQLKAGGELALDAISLVPVVGAGARELKIGQALSKFGTFAASSRFGRASQLGEVGVKGVTKGIGSNPFKGKTFEDIDKILTERGFTKVGPDPASGKGSYFHPDTGRKYYLDKGGVYKEGVEMPHVDVHRMENGLNLESVGKRRYPLGDSLIEEKINKRGLNANF